MDKGSSRVVNSNWTSSYRPVIMTQRPEFQHVHIFMQEPHFCANQDLETMISTWINIACSLVHTLPCTTCLFHRKVLQTPQTYKSTNHVSICIGSKNHNHKSFFVWSPDWPCSLFFGGSRATADIPYRSIDICSLSPLDWTLFWPPWYVVTW